MVTPLDPWRWAVLLCCARAVTREAGMQFFVAGATGRVGTAFVKQASAQGHSVVALVRSLDRGAALAPAQLVQGDALDLASLERLIEPGHTLISTLGGGAPTGPSQVVSTGTANLIAAATARGARRILAVVGAGVLQADAHRLRNELPDYPPFLRPIGAEHMAAYVALRASSLDWTLVAVPNIVDGPATGQFEQQRDYLPAGAGRITTGDIASFLLAEALGAQYARSRVGLNAK
jgi:putative NADH-flavin reductase